eukprot:6190552-Pleurochrysis_carterae.AAC.8
MFNAFPAEHNFTTHFGVAKASLQNHFSTQSEQLLRCISCARASESNLQLRLAFSHAGVDFDINTPFSTKIIDLPDNQRVHLEILVAADKKAVKAYRGCDQCSAWCTCPDTPRLALPWPAAAPPLSWDGPLGAAALLNKICKHPFPSIPLMYELAHIALPNEQLPRRCQVCNKRAPFASVAEYEAAHT